MGLFSGKDSAPSRKPVGKPRPSVTSEAHAADLRIKARRRLAGAVALILAAVVVLPMLLDSEPAPVASNIPIRIPDRQTPFQPNLSEPTAADTVAATSDQSTSSSNTSLPGSPGSAEGSASVGSISTQTKPVTESSATPPASEAVKAPVTKPVSPATPPSSQQRRDDAARALALLEGRTPTATAPTPQPPVRGSFVVQAMSLDSSADAQKQRNVLISAGLNNAFVDGPINVNGRPKYRVRVGPFQSREAAQAAQTRLRTQGYGGAFITTQ